MLAPSLHRESILLQKMGGFFNHYVDMVASVATYSLQHPMRCVGIFIRNRSACVSHVTLVIIIFIFLLK